MTRRDFSSRTPGAAASSPWELALLAVAALVLVAAVAEARSASAALGRARAALAEAQQDPAVRRVQPPRGARSPIALPLLLSAAAPPPVVLSDLAALLPASVRLESLALGYAGPISVDMQVVARHAADYDLFLERLGSSPRFTDVVPGEENRSGELRAAVHATYRGTLP